MIPQDFFPIEPWQIRETRLDLDLLGQTESLFALSNGHIGMRGNLDEGEPYSLPGTYLNSFYEVRPLPYAEAGYGYPQAGQTVVNVTNGKIIRLTVDDEPLDGLYVQGATESTHGLGSTLLSNVAVRAGEILDGIVADTSLTSGLAAAKGA